MMAKKCSTKFDMKRMTCLRGSVNTHSTLRNHSWVTFKDNGSMFLLKSLQSHVLWILAKPKHSHFFTKLYRAIKLFQEVLVLHGYFWGWISWIICWLCLLKEMGRPLCHVTRAFRQACWKICSQNIKHTRSREYYLEGNNVPYRKTGMTWECREW